MGGRQGNTGPACKGRMPAAGDRLSKREGAKAIVPLKTQIVAPGMWRINGICHERMYLVEGSRRAALIDSGSGFGDLAGLVRRLTDKPVTVLITHGHIDHAMGAAQFERAYMSPLDHAVCRLHGTDFFRKRELALSRHRDSVTPAEFIPSADPSRFLPLAEGDVFDLGGVTLEAIAAPGHTLGSMVFLQRETRTLYMGDACSNFTFLLGGDTLSVEAYAAVLRRLDARLAGQVDTILEAHGTGSLPTDIWRRVLAVCEDVMAGKSDRVPYTFRDIPGLMAKACAPHSLQRLDGGQGNLVYAEDCIFEKHA